MSGIAPPRQAFAAESRDAAQIDAVQAQILQASITAWTAPRRRHATAASSETDRAHRGPAERSRAVGGQNQHPQAGQTHRIEDGRTALNLTDDVEGEAELEGGVRLGLDELAQGDAVHGRWAGRRVGRDEEGERRPDELGVDVADGDEDGGDGVAEALCARNLSAAHEH